MNAPVPISDFVRRMRESLLRYERAETLVERQDAEDDMAAILRGRPERKIRDTKALQAGDDSD